MTSLLKPSRPTSMLLAGIIAAITIAVVANATTSLTVANAASITYSLAAGTDSALIAPATGRPVFAMGVQTAIGYRGVGQVTLLIPSVAPQFIEWVGLESPAAAAITSGFSSTVGTHIVYLDYSHTVDLRVAGATTVRVHNGSATTMAGSVTFIW